MCCGRDLLVSSLALFPTSVFFNKALILNPRPCRGRVGAPPLEVFLRCTPNYEADRAEILHSLWGILCATFGKKILTGSCQVTEL